MASSALLEAPPLNEHRLTEIGQAVQGLNPSQLQWASGYLAGLAAANVEPESAPEPVAKPQLSILFGSQTGNGKGVARQLAEAAGNKGITASLKDMADYQPRELAKEKLLLLVISTHGEGDPPDDAEEFWDYLKGGRAPQLADLKYAVLALGDSSYENFCQTGRDIDQRLQQLGAQRLLDRVECDLDYQQSTGQWQDSVLALVEPLVEDQEKAAITPLLRAVPASLPNAYSRQNPYLAEVFLNQKITARESGKDVRHIELGIDAASMAYLPGDSLGIIPRNSSDLVSEVLRLSGASADAQVEIKGETTSLEAALSDKLELTTLSRQFLENYAKLIDSAELNRLLEPDRRADLTQLMGSHQVIDILRRFPLSGEPQGLVSSLRGLAPRLYSLASSPDVYPDEAHLTVSVVDYMAFGHPHTGVASGHLAAMESGERAPVYLESNPRFRLPKDPDAPTIMFGAGTGVAPYRAFIDQRVHDNARGRNWLFYGDRHFRSDFLYQLEWQRHLKRGNLTRLDAAFSRDQQEKIYIQHRLLENAKAIHAWLEEGAHVYICGDSSQMAGDVHNALLQAVQTGSGISPEKAEEYLKTMKRQGRYQKDVY